MDRQPDGTGVVTVGSLHMDLITTVDAIPRAGASRVGTAFTMTPGGKAGNQAAQVARCGVASHLIARIGTDAFGDELYRHLSNVTINTSYVSRDKDVGTGASTVLVNNEGEYASVIVPGAAAELSVAEIDDAEPLFAAAACVLLQLELPLEISLAAARAARRHGTQVIVNAAPISAVPALAQTPLLADADLLVVNAAELAALTDHDFAPVDVQGAARALLASNVGPSVVVITLGAAGAMAVSTTGIETAAGLDVAVVDTVGAGDAFLGAFAASLARGTGLTAALRYGTVAGSLATTKSGAIAGQATHQAIQAHLQ